MFLGEFVGWLRSNTMEQQAQQFQQPQYEEMRYCRLQT